MGIDLVKGQKINLKKSNGNDLTSFCIGANWGAIEKKGFFGGVSMQAVDLDLSVGVFDENKNVTDIIYFGNLESEGIKHSGDDTTGDVDGDDGLDNEVIQIDLKNIPSDINQLVFILNSFNGDDFETIPFASIRLYEGTPEQVNNIVATYNISSDVQFSGSVSMILGKLYRRNSEWKFSAIGEPTKDKNLENTIKTVQQKYV